MKNTNQFTVRPPRWGLSIGVVLLLIAVFSFAIFTKDPFVVDENGTLNNTFFVLVCALLFGCFMVMTCLGRSVLVQNNHIHVQKLFRKQKTYTFSQLTKVIIVSNDIPTNSTIFAATIRSRLPSTMSVFINDTVAFKIHSMDAGYDQMLQKVQKFGVPIEYLP